MSKDSKPQSLGLFEASKSKTAANISVKREELAGKLGSTMFKGIVDHKIKEMEDWAYKVGMKAIKALADSEQACEQASKLKPDNVVISATGVRSENYTQETFNKKKKTFDTHNQLVDFMDKAFAGKEEDIKALEAFLDKNFK